VDFELQWIQAEIQNVNEDEYPEVRGELVQRKGEVSDADLQYRTRVDLEDPVRLSPTTRAFLHPI